MSSSEIYFDAFDPLTPVLRTPDKSYAQSEEIIQEEGFFLSLKLLLRAKISHIPSSCLRFFKDEEAMKGVVAFFGVATQVFTLGGASVGKAAPILSILGSPFYLYHALSITKERLNLLLQAYRTQQVADALFWAGKAVDSMGTAISDIVKPFAGGVELSGLSHIGPIGVIFSLVIPIFLIVFGAIGGIWETWALVKASKGLKQFEEKAEKCGDSIAQLVSLLEFLKGPQQFLDRENEKTSQAKRDLESKEFSQTFFSNDKRQNAIKTKIESFLTKHQLHEIRSTQEKLASHEVKAAVSSILEKLKTGKQDQFHLPLEDMFEMIKEVQGLYQTLLTDDINLSSIEKTLTLYRKIILLFEEVHSQELLKEHQPFLNHFLEDLKENFTEICDLKNSVLEEGHEILHLARSEIHRKLCNHATLILIAILTLTSGILFIACPQHQSIASGLAIASSTLNILHILFEKSISEERFLQLHRFLKGLHQKNL